MTDQSKHLKECSKEPKCKICRDTKQVPRPMPVHPNACNWVNIKNAERKIPCPDCTVQEPCKTCGDYKEILMTCAVCRNRRGFRYCFIPDCPIIPCPDCTTQEQSEDKACDGCGKNIDTSSEGILTDRGELLCMECQVPTEPPANDKPFKEFIVLGQYNFIGFIPFGEPDKIRLKIVDGEGTYTKAEIEEIWMHLGRALAHLKQTGYEPAHIDKSRPEPTEQPEAKCVKCGKIFYCVDDYDTLGSDSGICCPDCGGEEFEPIKQPPTSNFTKEVREFIIQSTAVEGIDQDNLEPFLAKYGEYMSRALKTIDTETQRAEKAEAEKIDVKEQKKYNKDIRQACVIWSKDYKLLEAKLKDLLDIKEVIQNQSNKLDAQIAEGKHNDAWPKAEYIKDDDWAGMIGERLVYHRVLNLFEAAITKEG